MASDAAHRRGVGRRTGATGYHLLEFETRVANIAKALPGILLQAPLEQLSNQRRRFSRERVPIDIVLEDRREDLRLAPCDQVCVPELLTVNRTSFG